METTHNMLLLTVENGTRSFPTVRTSHGFTKPFETKFIRVLRLPVYIWFGIFGGSR